MSELDNCFEKAKAEHTDMQGHMDVIKSYAGQSATIAEFGVYDCTSTWALLAGRPQQLTSYDIARRAEVDDVERVAASSGLSFKFVLADSTAVDIGKVDLLFIDSLHTYGHLAKELAIHAKNVNKWIIMHDTVTFGHQDQPDWSNPGPGLWPAVEEFLAANKSWKIHEHFTHFHGLTVLSNG